MEKTTSWILSLPPFSPCFDPNPSMAFNEPRQGLGTQIEIRGSEFEFQEADPEELEKLEMEVKEMAQKILQYRASLPDQLKDTLASVLAAHRPVFPEGSEPGTSGYPKPGTLSRICRLCVFFWLQFHQDW